MLAIRLMQLFSHNKSDFTKLAGILGLSFQIRDDYKNLCSKDVSLCVHVMWLCVKLCCIRAVNVLFTVMLFVDVNLHMIFFHSLLSIWTIRAIVKI